MESKLRNLFTCIALDGKYKELYQTELWAPNEEEAQKGFDAIIKVHFPDTRKISIKQHPSIFQP